MYPGRDIDTVKCMKGLHRVLVQRGVFSQADKLHLLPGLGDESSERMVERHWNTDTKSDGSELRGPKEAVFRQRFGCCRFRVPADCDPPIHALSALSLFNQTLNNDSKSGVALFHMGKKKNKTSTQFQITAREQGSSVSADGRFQSFYTNPCHYDTRGRKDTAGDGKKEGTYDNAGNSVYEKVN